MTRFGQSEMVIARNQLSLFAPKSDRDIPGQIGTNRDNLTGGEGHIPGHSGTPPLKGGVHCPGVTGRDMSRSRPVPAEGITKRNESRKAIFDAWLAECRAYDAAGRQDEVPPLPAGYLSSGPKLWREGATYSGKRWR
jgi:hypothetical protein